MKWTKRTQNMSSYEVANRDYMQKEEMYTEINSLPSYRGATEQITSLPSAKQQEYVKLDWLRPNTEVGRTGDNCCVQNDHVNFGV